MILFYKIIQKAVVQTAAFFILLMPQIGLAKSKAINSELQDVEKKAINLLIQKQKKQALETLTDYISNENNKNLLIEAREFRQNLAKKFPTKESQEAYETSLNLTVDNPKEAKKNIEDCLLLDPENFDCLVQRLRLIYRENRKKPIESAELERISKYFESSDANWVKASTEQYLVGKNPVELKTLNFSKNEMQSTADEKLIFMIFNLNKALFIKNLIKAKEILDEIEKKFSDWPDIIYFKNRIAAESLEQNPLTTTEMLNQYLSKCKNLNKSTVRKYRYDFDLCLRGGI